MRKPWRWRGLVVQVAVVLGALTAATTTYTATAAAAGFARGTHTPNPNTDVCGVNQLRVWFMGTYIYPEHDFRCVYTDKDQVSESDLYVNGEPESAPGGTNAQALVEVIPDVVNGRSQWKLNVQNLHTRPAVEKRGPTINGVASVWFRYYDEWVMMTPYGKSSDVVVMMFPQSTSSTALPRGAEGGAEAMVATVEQSVFH